VLRETTSRGRCELVCPSRTKRDYEPRPIELVCPFTAKTLQKKVTKNWIVALLRFSRYRAKFFPATGATPVVLEREGCPKAAGLRFMERKSGGWAGWTLRSAHRRAPPGRLARMHALAFTGSLQRRMAMRLSARSARGSFRCQQGVRQRYCRASICAASSAWSIPCTGSRQRAPSAAQATASSR